MKIRMGFVSNSSSSSFVMIVEKGWFEECMKKLDEYTQYVVKNSSEFSEQKVLGQDCIVIEGWSDEDEYTHLHDMKEHQDEVGLDFYEQISMRDNAFEKFEVEVYKNKEYVFSYTMDS